MTHHTLGKKTYELLLDNILTGKYKPGQRLTYELVTTDLGVSLTPMKEAFLRLEEQGLLVTVARRGTFVRQFLKKDIEELYQIREMMEALAVRLACRKAADKDLKELRRIHAKLSAAVERGDMKNCVRTDIQFHEEIARMSGNNRLLHTLKHSLFTNLFCISSRGEQFVIRGGDIIVNHQDLIGLIELRDEDAAERSMRQQIRQGGEWILCSLKD